MNSVRHFFSGNNGGYVSFAAILLLGLYFRWPLPSPEWQHIDERAFILHPLGFWSGDLNPHFFNYPTLHFYLTSALYYLYYLLGDFESLTSFVAYRYFVDGSDLIGIVRGFNSVLSALTGVVCVLIGRRLYGLWAGLAAGALFAVLPLSVRFAHLANVDSPQVFWSSLALLFALRVVESGRWRDALWAGVCTGLSMATKYPGALACVPVFVACGLRFGWFRGPIWLSGLAAGGVFAVCSPYVLLDWSSAWESIAAMGNEHMVDDGHGGGKFALWHHVQYNLRYGVGFIGLLGLVGGVGWKFAAYRPMEWVVLSGLVSWLVLLGVSSSVFMRYALPLGPLVVLFWARGLWLVGDRMWLVAGLLLLLGLEPLYGSYKTRSLQAGEDTRVMARQWIGENAPPGTYLIHLAEGAGHVKAIYPGGIYIRQNYYLQYFNGTDLIDSYRHLAGRQDLPPLYVGLNTETGLKVSAETFDGAPSRGILLDYHHPLIRSNGNAASKALLQRGKWLVEFDPGKADNAVFDAVDWYFLPIGSFAGIERSGPRIRIGAVAIKKGKRPIPMGDFFAVLRDILLAKKALAIGDVEGALKLYQEVWNVPFSLDDTLPPEFMYDVLTNMGLAYSRREELERAAEYWRAAIALKSEHADVHHNLGAIYAKMGRVEDAFAVWEKALSLDPNRASTYYNMGNIHYHQGEYEQAIMAWSRVVELDADYKKVYYNMGNAYYKIKKLEQALEAYRQSLDRDPENSDIYYNIAQVYIDQGNDTEAIQYLRQSLEYNDQDPEAYYLLGGLYKKTNKVRQARLSYERFLQLSPAHPRANLIREVLQTLAQP